MSVPPVTTAAALPAINQIPLSAANGAPGAVDFGQVLKAAINQVEQVNHGADTAIGKFLSGEEGELHTTALAVQKADLQFDMFLQVRNKVLSAYQEIMRMQV